MPQDTAQQNPLLADWSTSFGAPPFAAIRPEHFRPAFDEGLAVHEAEVRKIAENGEEPNFSNTIDALELSGKKLRQVSAVFFNLAGADTNEALEAIQREFAPLLARHRTRIYLDDGLFRRIDALWSRRDALDLTPEQARVLER